MIATFGFSLHFRGESTAVPTHWLTQSDVAEEEVDRRVIVVQPDEEYMLLTAFLESVYIDRADRPSPALEGKTPRHAAAVADTRQKVEGLINAVEQNGLALRRTGRSGYDYNRLRAHIWLSEAGR